MIYVMVLNLGKLFILEKKISFKSLFTLRMKLGYILIHCRRTTAKLYFALWSDRKKILRIQATRGFLQVISKIFFKKAKSIYFYSLPVNRSNVNGRKFICAILREKSCMRAAFHNRNK